MATPAFRHMGGKARLRKWLVAHFPDGDGGTYLEPFAGKANVFFAAHTLNFNRWKLTDIDISFLDAVMTAPLDELPTVVTKEDFEYWKSANTKIAKLIEPRITYAGKGYRYGYSGSSGTHVGYAGSTYRQVCERARQLLTKADIQQCHWEDAIRIFEPSFVYLDPPYYGTNASYQNIDHQQLVELLNAARFSWALSGYRNHLYDTQLEFKCRFEYERNSEIKGSNSRNREPVIETLWTNYEL